MNSYLLILLGHIKKFVYKWDWKSYCKTLSQRMISWFLEDGTVSAVSERSLSFWWYNILRSPCKSDLLYFLFFFFNSQFIFPGHCSSGCDSQCCPNVKFILQKWSTTDLVFIVHKTLAIIRLYMWHFISILCNVWAELYKFYMIWHSLVYILVSFNKAWVL